MVYLVGGYKLTVQQVREWGQARNIDTPRGGTMYFINEWLLDNGITDTHVVCCDYRKQTIYLFVTDNRNGTDEEFEENEKAREIKTLLGLGAEHEFVTVANPYGK